MSKLEKFDWSKFHNLANRLYDKKNEEKLRTGINRYYFSSFYSSRDFLIENGLFLNEKNEKIMKSKESDVHYETRKTFKKHDKFKNKKSAQQIAKNLEYLRKKRNKVDYNNSKMDLKDVFEYSKRKSGETLELLEELN